MTAVDWLVRELEAGERPAARAAAISERTLERAKADLGVRSRLAHQAGRREWRWALPARPEASA